MRFWRKETTEQIIFLSYLKLILNSFFVIKNLSLKKKTFAKRQSTCDAFISLLYCTCTSLFEAFYSINVVRKTSFRVLRAPVALDSSPIRMKQNSKLILFDFRASASLIPGILGDAAILAPGAWYDIPRCKVRACPCERPFKRATTRRQNLRCHVSRFGAQWAFSKPTVRNYIRLSTAKLSDRGSSGTFKTTSRVSVTGEIGSERKIATRVKPTSTRAYRSKNFISGHI